MRLLEIFPNDRDLFDKDINSADFVFYRSHIPTFKRMWNDQGSTFWLRFLVSFREFMKTVNYEKLFIEKALGEFPMCSHNFFLCMDLGFIRIHKMFLEGDFSSAKTLVCDIFTLAQNLHLLSQLHSSSLVYDPFYSTSTRDSFRNLFGLPHDKESLIKVAINYPLYLKFGGAVFQLLRRWLSENDIPEKDLPNVNTQYQYWVSYDTWFQEDFHVEYFESYIAKIWGERLQAMLLASNIHNIFLREKVSLCNCNNKKNGFIKREVVEYCKSHSLCRNHKECRLKIIHNLKCKDPQFCMAENSTCILSCETEIKKMKSINAQEWKSGKSAEGERSFWKQFEVYIEPCSQSNCRNVGTLVESYDWDIESYYLPKDVEVANAFQTFVDELSEVSCNTGLGMSAEVVNAVFQCRRVEAIKNRLRSKLSKKNRLRNIKLFEDPAYRLKMVKEASKKFRKDLEIEAQACGCDDWKAHEKDTCKNILKNNIKVIRTSKSVEICKVNLHKQSESKGISDTSLDRNNNSIAVGTDERSGFGKVMQPQRKKPKMKKKSSKDLNPEEAKPGKKTSNILSQNVACPSGIVKEAVDSVASGPELSNITAEVASEKITHPTEAVFIDANEGSKNLTNSPVQGSENSENSVNCANNIKKEGSSDKDILKNRCVPIPEDSKMVEKVKVKHELTKIWNEIMTKYNGEKNETERNADHSTENGENSTDPVDKLLSVLTNSSNNRKEEIVPTLNSVKGNEAAGVKLEKLNNGIKEDAVTDVKPGKKSKLHVCVHCKRKETEPRTFKKCSRCKAENFPEPRYYCTRECQVEDWEESHRDEHLKRKMEK